MELSYAHKHYVCAANNSNKNDQLCDDSIKVYLYESEAKIL